MLQSNPYDVILYARIYRQTTKETSVPRQHQSKSMKKVLTELVRLGFSVNQNKSGVYRIIPPKGIEGPTYTTHGTESALHPMRRDFKKYYNISINI